MPLTTLTPDEWHILATAVLWLVGFVSVLRTRKLVSRWRRPLYTLAIPLAATFAFIYTLAFVQGRDSAIPTDLGWIDVVIFYAIRISLLGVALLFIFVPYVDRLERKLLPPRVPGEYAEGDDEHTGRDA